MADSLCALGIREASGRRHLGQGTANRRFFFANIMLEFLWVDNPAEAQPLLTQPTQLWERYRGRECPFGFAWRGSPIPFAAWWAYRPLYLPSDSKPIAIAKCSNQLRQPFLFRIPFPPGQEHRNLQYLTQVRLSLPETPAACLQKPPFVWQQAETPALELWFSGDEAGQGKPERCLDFAPEIPLRLRGL